VLDLLLGMYWDHYLEPLTLEHQKRTETTVSSALGYAHSRHRRIYLYRERDNYEDLTSTHLRGMSSCNASSRKVHSTSFFAQEAQAGSNESHFGKSVTTLECQHERHILTLIRRFRQRVQVCSIASCLVLVSRLLHLGCIIR